MGGKGGGSISFPDIPNIPRLDVGTNFVAQDGLAFLHEGEAVVPKKYNPAAGAEGIDYDELGKTMAKYLNFDFYIGDEHVARSANRGNAEADVGNYFP